MPAGLRIILLLGIVASLGARCVSPNFEVTAPTDEVARAVADQAEKERVKLAIVWYGHELPNWKTRCPVSVTVGATLGAGGKTKFRFSRGHVYGWDMEVQGSIERILDSVIPHEVNHTILACYFRRPLPRWADEGMASLMEHESEQQRQRDHLNQVMHQGGRIPLRSLLALHEYPQNEDQVLALYAEGHALTDFLVQQGGRAKFLSFLEDAHHRGWDAALQSVYGRKSVEHLEQSWQRWVYAGCPKLNLPDGQLLASSPSAGGPRAQSPDGAAGTSLALASAVSSQPREALTGAPDPRLSARARGIDSNPALATRPAPEPSEPLALRPLTLRAIEDAPAPVASPQIELPEPAPLRRLELRPVSLPSEGSAHTATRTMEEATLRTAPAAQPASDRFLDWSRFPTRERVGK